MMNLLSSQSADRFHLSRDVLTRMAGQELPLAGSLLATRHVSRCELCQTKYDRISRTAKTAAEYREHLIARLGPLNTTRRDSFIQQLDEVLESIPATTPWKRFASAWQLRNWGSSRPAFASALGMILAGIIVFFLWRGRLPAVSAAELLNRAVASDSIPSKSDGSGVIRRRLRIKTKQKTIEHDVYRDLSGRRQPKYVRGDTDETTLAALLALAGVNWDDPLSAISFKTWHDRQNDAHDELESSSDKLLTISTQLTSTNIASESLTVKKDNFHPVERTIEFRDRGSVTISEVSFDVLSWGKSNQFFVGAEPVINAVAPRGHTRESLPPTEQQIDETELLARVKLNEKNADSGEQIEITRDVHGVQVQGFVETEDRKRELNEALRDIPFLSVRLGNFDELKTTSDSPIEVKSNEARTVMARVSPLEEFFVEHGRNRDELSRISAGLFDCSVSINRLGRTIERISQRFSGDKALSAVSIRARDQLLARDVAHLLDDLNRQQQLLNDTGIGRDAGALTSSGPAVAKLGLARIAEQNMAATRALISGDAASSPSEHLAADLVETILQLRAATVTFIPNHSIQP
jgi:hypothetical protein